MPGVKVGMAVAAAAATTTDHDQVFQVSAREAPSNALMKPSAGVLLLTVVFTRTLVTTASYCHWPVSAYHSCIPPTNSGGRAHHRATAPRSCLAPRGSKALEQILDSAIEDLSKKRRQTTSAEDSMAGYLGASATSLTHNRMDEEKRALELWIRLVASNLADIPDASTTSVVTTDDGDRVVLRFRRPDYASPRAELEARRAEHDRLTRALAKVEYLHSTYDTMERTLRAWRQRAAKRRDDSSGTRRLRAQLLQAARDLGGRSKSAPWRGLARQLAKELELDV